MEPTYNEGFDRDSNPYISPPAREPQPHPDITPGSTIAVFVVLNFCFAGLCFVVLGLLGALLCYGIFVSGDTGVELTKGIIGIAVLSMPSLIGGIIFVAAGIGLLKRRTWGYYLHIVGAVLAAFSCVGCIYTILAIIFALKPEFAAAFRRVPNNPDMTNQHRGGPRDGET